MNKGVSSLSFDKAFGKFSGLILSSGVFTYRGGFQDVLFKGYYLMDCFFFTWTFFLICRTLESWAPDYSFILADVFFFISDVRTSLTSQP